MIDEEKSDGHPMSSEALSMIEAVSLSLSRYSPAPLRCSSGTLPSLDAQEDRMVSDAIPVMAWMCHTDGRRFSFNHVWGEYTGRTPEEEYGHGWEDCIHPEDLDTVRQHFRESLANGRAFHVRYRLKRHDASYRWFMDSAVPRFDENGELAGYIGAAVDITEEKQHNAQLAAEVATLISTNERLEKFALFASHDMQEPLRMILNFTGLLVHEYRDCLDETGKQYLDFTQEAAKRLHILLQDLLDYSRLEEPQEAVRIDCEREVIHALENLGSLIEETGARIEHDALPCIQGYPGRFTRLIQNLVGNAMKYHRQGVVPEIYIRAEDRGDAWRFSVADNGQGIAPEYRERIFDMFARLHSQREGAGSGLGLAICRKIVESLGGRICVESEPGTGSIFYFTIPKAMKNHRSETGMTHVLEMEQGRGHPPD